MNLENISTYLKEYASWCDWKKEKRKSGTTKVPYSPKTGNHAYVDRPDTFADFNSAVSAMNNYDGMETRNLGIGIPRR